MTCVPRRNRLVQTEKLASLGQAHRRHRARNQEPAHFVNNFSSLSTELIDELNDVLKSASIDGKAREEIDELTQYAEGNLDKVVQHGKRADSIVKNMLLHSREGSGEHRRPTSTPLSRKVSISPITARGGESGFNITLKRDLDPAAA